MRLDSLGAVRALGWAESQRGTKMTRLKDVLLETIIGSLTTVLRGSHDVEPSLAAGVRHLRRRAAGALDVMP